MYVTLAHVYDSLMKDVDYESMADRIVRIFGRHRIEPALVLDLGCGTGSLALAMMARGYDLIGVDKSPDMLGCAAEKASEAGRELLLLQQDITSFELYGTVGAVLATMDVLNHVTDKRKLFRTFKLVRNYLDPGGLFLFDLNSPYKLSCLLPGQTFYQVDEAVTWLWNSGWDKRRSVCTFDLTFFFSDGEGRYVRQDDMQEERAWEPGEIRELLERAGLELLSLQDGETFRKPGPESERLLFVARRPMNGFASPVRP